MVVVDETMRQLIHDAASEQELARYARSMAPSIGEDGKRKILAGQTTVEEVLRVSLDD
jgi:general secretion pathway protein E